MLKSLGALVLLMVSATDRAWLAGLVDGEGCFIFAFKYSDGGKQMCFEPQFALAVTDEACIETVSSVLSRAGIGHGKYRQQARKQGYQAQYIIRFGGWNRMEQFCGLIEPFSHVKSKQVKLMLKFSREPPHITQRFQSREGLRRKVDWYAVEESLSLMDAIRAVNGKQKGGTKWTRDEITKLLRESDGQLYSDSSKLSSGHK